jgi:anti-sigma regulatory factor (Ser/Thr protein kinase)
MEWMDFDTEWLFRAELALHEALHNAHHHGNSGNRERKIRVTCTLTHDVVEIDVADEGTGYITTRPMTVVDLAASHGRGLYLIYQLMKSVRILEGGKRIIMSLSKE